MASESQGVPPLARMPFAPLGGLEGGSVGGWLVVLWVVLWVVLGRLGRLGRLARKELLELLVLLVGEEGRVACLWLSRMGCLDRLGWLVGLLA